MSNSTIGSLVKLTELDKRGSTALAANGVAQTVKPRHQRPQKAFSIGSPRKASSMRAGAAAIRPMPKHTGRFSSTAHRKTTRSGKSHPADSAALATRP